MLAQIFAIFFQIFHSVLLSNSMNKFVLPSLFSKSVQDFQKIIPAYSFIPVCSFISFQKMPVCSFIRNFRMSHKTSGNNSKQSFLYVSNILLEPTFYLNDLSFQPVFPYQSLGHLLSFLLHHHIKAPPGPGKNLSFLLEGFGTYFPNCMYVQNHGPQGLMI